MRSWLFLVGLVFPPAFADGLLPSLPLDDPAVSLLERLDGRGGCRLGDRRPWSGEQVLACAQTWEASLPEGPDRRALAELSRRLSLRDSFPSGWGRRPAWKAAHGSDSAVLAFDLGVESHASWAGRTLAYGDSSTMGHDAVVGGRLRPRVDVLLGPHLAMWSRVRQITEVSDAARWIKAFDARHGVYQTALFLGSGEYGKARTSDWVEGAIEARAMGVRARTGLLPLRWGSLPIEPLMFSGNTEGMAMTEVSTSVGPVEATVIGARLIGDTFDEPRRLYAHRYRWRGRSWSFAWSEAVISVEPDLQPLYLVPVFPHIFVEHFLGDPDNRQMDFDLSWAPREDLEFSGELFLDDLQNYFGFLSDGWGNKWALGLGVRGRDWTGPRTVDRLQVARIEPWVGTSSSAVLPGAERNLPVHFGVSLGSSAGPNSLAATWMRHQDLADDWAFETRVGLLWKGTDLGSSLDDLNWRDSSGTWVTAQTRKKWLSGELVRAQEFAAAGQWRFAPQWRARFEAGLGHRSDSTGTETWPFLSLQVAFRD